MKFATPDRAGKSKILFFNNDIDSMPEQFHSHAVEAACSQPAQQIAIRNLKRIVQIICID